MCLCCHWSCGTRVRRCEKNQPCLPTPSSGPLRTCAQVERAIRESGPQLESTLRYALDVSQKLVISREFREQVGWPLCFLPFFLRIWVSFFKFLEDAPAPVVSQKLVRAVIGRRRARGLGGGELRESYVG